MSTGLHAGPEEHKGDGQDSSQPSFGSFHNPIGGADYAHHTGMYQSTFKPFHQASMQGSVKLILSLPMTTKVHFDKFASAIQWQCREVEFTTLPFGQLNKNESIGWKIFQNDLIFRKNDKHHWKWPKRQKTAKIPDFFQKCIRTKSCQNAGMCPVTVWSTVVQLMPYSRTSELRGAWLTWLSLFIPAHHLCQVGALPT